MTKSLLAKYHKFKAAGSMLVGYSSATALESAKVLEQWEQAEDELVKLVAEPEMESYFDVFGEPEAYEGAHGKRVSAEQARKELEDLLERDGNWCVVSYYHDGDKWQVADSIGQCTGYSNPCSPYENCYVIDLMRSALKAHADHVEEMAAAV